jgi:hypothetical protein
MGSIRGGGSARQRMNINKISIKRGGEIARQIMNINNLIK